MTITTAQNGTTVHVTVGGRLALIGFTNDWMPISSDPAVVSGPEPLAPCHPAHPGMECVMSPLIYTASAKGTVQLSAHRAQCGEARQCVPPELPDFTLTVVVD